MNTNIPPNSLFQGGTICSNAINLATRFILMFWYVQCCTIWRMKPTRYLLGLIAILAIVQLTPLQMKAFTIQRAGQQAQLSALPAWPGITAALALTPVMRADLNGDGRLENLILDSKAARIEQGGQAVWSSPVDWQVVQALIGDLDRDGQPEVDLLVWRPFRPWPVDRFLPYGGRIDSFQDSQGRSCQVVLIAWRGAAYQERWAGSALAEPLQAFAAVDLNGDGMQELVGLETSYAAPPGAPADAISAWSWNGFGFSLLARRYGAFRQMAFYAPQSSEPFILLQR
jgi:hypothetical protein